MSSPLLFFGFLRAGKEKRSEDGELPHGHGGGWEGEGSRQGRRPKNETHQEPVLLLGSGVSCGRPCPEWHTSLLLSRSPRMEGAWKAPWDADGLIELVPSFLAGAAPLDVDHNLTGALIDGTGWEGARFYHTSR